MKRLFTYIFSVLPLIGFAQVDSLSINEAVSKALENNYGIVIQEKTRDINAENNTWGNAGALPTVSFTGAGSQTWANSSDYADYTSSALSATVGLDWVVFRGFAARIQKENLEKLQDQSDASLALLTENTIVDITLAYYNILLQKENMISAEDVMELSEDRYKKEKLKNDLGSATKYELLQSQNSWLEDKANYLTAKTSHKNALRQLNYLMAEPIDQHYELTSELITDTTDFDLDTLKQKMFSNNKTLVNQYINLEIAKLSVRSAKSAYYPTVTVGAESGYVSSNTEYPDYPSSNSKWEGISSEISGAVTYDIYEGGTRRAAVKIAKMQEEISETETSEMKAELENQLAQEYELYNNRKELLNLAKEQLNAAKLNLELSTQKFESGAINSFNYRDVQQIYISAVTNYLSSIYNVIESNNTLLQLTGGIIEEVE